MKTKAGNLDIEIRKGTPEDIPQVLSFIREMAEFENLPVHATAEGLMAVLYGVNPAAQVILVYAGDQPVAYANYFFTFSSMLGKRGIWLDDIYVSPPYRGKKVGHAIMAYVAQVAVDNDCCRFEWSVLDWNEYAIGFYKKLGANIMEEWRICRLEGDAIRPVAERWKKEVNP
jgi:GNAT superfamily N-acetyltransferase